MALAKLTVAAYGLCAVLCGQVAQGNSFHLVRTETAVSGDGGSSRGIAWGDFDNDGDPDLAVSNTDNQPLFLYRNAGKGQFELVTAPPFDRFRGNSEGVTWVDFDNDGRLDLFVARTAGPNALFRNEGGSFHHFDGGPLSEDETISSQGCWADFDKDGWLDVFVVNRNGQDDILYHNIRGGTFRRLKGPFSGRGGDGRTCAVGDANGDGRPDIYVGNFLEPGATSPRKAANFFYLNSASGFSEIVRGHFVNTPSLTYGASWADFDNDGDLDLFVTNIALGDRNLLYENLGDSQFLPREDLALSTNSLGPSKGHAWGDFDNDGDVDLVVAEGTEDISAEGRARGYDVFNRMYLNDGNGQFTEVKSPLTEDEHISAGIASTDYDGDGDLDIAVANWGGNDENNALYENRSSGNWISLTLQGTRSNRQGIGAKVVIAVTDEAGTHIQRRWAWPQTGYASMNHAALHFGMNTAQKVNRIQIYWPSGTIDEYDERPANGRFVAIEGRSLRPAKLDKGNDRITEQ